MMIRAGRPSLYLLLILSLSLGFRTGIARDYETDRVVLVIIDGLRYSEGLGDPSHEFTPHMSALAAEGALVANFQNDGYTYTSRAVPAIWCGNWTIMNTFSDSTCEGASNSYSTQPSLFEYYRKNLSRPQSDCVYSLKDLCSWKGSFHPEYGPDYWPSYHTAGLSDEDVWHETEQIIAGDAPHLLLMYLADVDHEGHSGDWEAYTHAIQIADSLMGLLWEALQDDPNYAGRTTLIVTNDHGRHSNNFAGHGDDCDGCRRIQLLTVGPDVNPGMVSDVSRTIPDITPTIGFLLGFSTEYATGSPMLELFHETTAIQDQQPLQHELLSIYPNPGNPGSSLQLTLQEAGEVQVLIYNIQGQPKRVLYQGFLAPGKHVLSWNGRDETGRVLVSGTYLVQVKTPTTLETRKLVLLK